MAKNEPVLLEDSENDLFAPLVVEFTPVPEKPQKAAKLTMEQAVAMVDPMALEEVFEEAHAESNVFLNVFFDRFDFEGNDDLSVLKEAISQLRSKKMDLMEVGTVDMRSFKGKKLDTSSIAITKVDHAPGRTANLSKTEYSAIGQWVTR